MSKYNLVPKSVPRVNTPHRKINTKLPVPESLEVLELLRQTEPRSMQGQPPLIWHTGEGCTIRDPWGNSWLDWSSGVLITNVGHGHPKVRAALRELVDRPLLTTYVFPHEGRARLDRELQKLSPDPENYRAFLLTTGSEDVENALKLARTYAARKHGPNKCMVVSFKNGFHGRTLGSQLAGGMDKQKEWIHGEGATFVQVPFPDGYKNEDVSFDRFLSSLAQLGVEPADVAVVILETYQGVGPDFLPNEYAQQLASFCAEHDIVLAMDEVQAGFGRTGTMFGYEQYGIKPDLIICGKGISSSLPLSAVIGRSDIMDLYPAGSMTSTHSGSPLPVAAALASIEVIREEKLLDHVKKMEPVLLDGLKKIQAKHPEVLGCVHGRGLVAGIQVVKAGTKEPDGPLALAINERCFQKGLIMFAPVGIGGECIKISPPLVITEDAIMDGLQALEEAVDEVMAER